MKQIYGSAVEIDGRAVLIIGASGSGKSTLARDLMAMGARLIGDDQVFLDADAGQIFVSPHQNANGRFEVRGVGLFKTVTTPQAELIYVLNLNDEPQSRMPEQLIYSFDGIKIHQFDIKGLPQMAAFTYLLLTQKIEKAE